MPGGLSFRWEQVSGPGRASFAAAADYTTASFSAGGVYVLRLTASDGAASASDELTVVANVAPVVSAGPDRLIRWPASVELAGSVNDDGLPGSGVEIGWSVVSGPGAVTFADEHAAATSATFSEQGAYILRLWASDGATTASDEVRVVAAVAPTVDVGPDLVVNLPATAQLAALISDELVGSVVPVQWACTSGPAPVRFADAGAAQTAATFAEKGVYVLRLSVGEGDLGAADELAALVNRAPTITAGADGLARVGEALALHGVVQDDGLGDPQRGAVTAMWQVVQGPGAVTFDDAHTLDTTARFAAAGAYELRLEVSNGFVASADALTVRVGGRVRDGLLVCYPFTEGAGAVVHDVAGVGEPLNLSIEAIRRDGVRWTDAGLIVTRPTLLVSAGPATKISDAVRRTGELTIEAGLRRTTRTTTRSTASSPYRPTRVAATSPWAPTARSTFCATSTRAMPTRPA